MQHAQVKATVAAQLTVQATGTFCFRKSGVTSMGFISLQALCSKAECTF